MLSREQKLKGALRFVLGKLQVKPNSSNQAGYQTNHFKKKPVSLSSQRNLPYDRQILNPKT